MEGVVRTRVGYSGGTGENPTYRSIGDHSETIQMDYDPASVSFDELLEIFWAAHDPTSRSWLTQYKSAIFYMNEEQKRLAIASREREEAKRGEKIVTEMLPFTGFYLAEAYHQKHRLRGEELFWEEFSAIYPDIKDFVDSTAAARVNGFLSGFGSSELLKREIDSYGLSEKARERLLGVARVLRVSRNASLADACPI